MYSSGDYLFIFMVAVLFAAFSYIVTAAATVAPYVILIIAVLALIILVFAIVKGFYKHAFKIDCLTMGLVTFFGLFFGTQDIAENFSTALIVPLVLCLLAGISVSVGLWFLKAKTGKIGTWIFTIVFSLAWAGFITFATHRIINIGVLEVELPYPIVFIVVAILSVFAHIYAQKAHIEKNALDD